MIETVVLVLIVVLGSILFQHFWSSRKLYAFANRLPGPVALPIIGNGLLFNCKTEDIYDVLLHNIRKYESPMRLWLGPKLIAIFCKLPHVEKILSSTKITYKGEIYKFIASIVGAGLITGSGPKWKEHRKLIQPMVNLKFVTSQLEIIQKHSNKLIKSLEKLVGTSFVDIQHILHPCCFDIIGESICGVEMNTQDGKNLQIYHYFEDFYDNVFTQMIKPWLHPNVFFNMTHYKKKRDVLVNGFHTFFKGKFSVTMNQPLLYSKNSSIQLNDAEFVLDNYLKLMKWNPEGGDSILDVGCGPGDVTTRKLLPQVPQNFGKLVCADLSQEMVHFARSQNRHPKVGFSIIDISSKKLQPEWYGQFEHLFSFYCLHWIQDQRQAFKNMYDLLKSGGDMLVTLVGTIPIFDVYENMSTSNKWMEYLSDTSTHISPYHKCKDTERIIENLLGDIGFSTHVCNVIERKYVFTDLTVFRKFVMAINPFIGKIPHGLHNDYLLDFIDEMRNMNLIEECKKADNSKVTVCMPYELIVIVASKPH